MPKVSSGALLSAHTFLCGRFQTNILLESDISPLSNKVMTDGVLSLNATN